MSTSIRETISGLRRCAANLWLKPARVLIAAAIFHLAITLTIFGIGRFGMAPQTIDSDGIGISFAIDGILHRTDAIALSELLKRGEVLSWVTSPLPLHDKLYSVCFAIFGSWLGFTIISVEPLNLLCYLGILILVYQIGKQAFGERVGRIAAVTIALWPSFLLHTTQLLREPLFVLEMLALVMIVMRFLSQNYGWLETLRAGTAGGLLGTVLWLTRDRAAEIVIAILLLGVFLLVVKQVRRASIQVTNLAGMILLFTITIAAQQLLPKSIRPGPVEGNKVVVTDATNTSNVVPTPGVSSDPYTSRPSRLVTSISTARRRFSVRYPDAGSNIDHDVSFAGATEIIRYLPRATVIGFLAPFPDMWFVPGKEVGTRGRLLAGFETLVVYAFEALALFALWYRRRQPSVWFLFGSAVIGMIALGLVVVNVAALYRMRYGFLILVIIIGTDGVLRALYGPSKKPEDLG